MYKRSPEASSCRPPPYSMNINTNTRPRREYIYETVSRIVSPGEVFLALGEIGIHNNNITFMLINYHLDAKMGTVEVLQSEPDRLYLRPLIERTRAIKGHTPCSWLSIYPFSDASKPNVTICLIMGSAFGQNTQSVLSIQRSTPKWTIILTQVWLNHRIDGDMDIVNISEEPRQPGRKLSITPHIVCMYATPIMPSTPNRL